jgi:hypothetical protein
VPKKKMARALTRSDGFLKVARRAALTRHPGGQGIVEA